jgi:hypothetical protein
MKRVDNIYRNIQEPLPKKQLTQLGVRNRQKQQLQQQGQQSVHVPPGATGVHNEMDSIIELERHFRSTEDCDKAYAEMGIHKTWSNKYKRYIYITMNVENFKDKSKICQC